MTRPPDRELCARINSTQLDLGDAQVLAGRVARVLVLHSPDSSYNEKHSDGWFHRCLCGKHWPCPTVCLLDGADE